MYRSLLRQNENTLQVIVEFLSRVLHLDRKERTALLLLLKVVLFIQVSGLEELVMGQVFKNGQMELDMRDNGKIIKHMDLENSGMLMVTSLKVSGRMTRQMERGLIPILMVQSMKETGKMIFKMDLEQKLGLMDLNMKEITRVERNTDMEPMFGWMVVNMLVSGSKTKSVVQGYIHG